MLAFIDTSTGTWGCAEDIVFVEVDPAILDVASDSEIIEYGNLYGDAPFLPNDM